MVYWCVKLIHWLVHGFDTAGSMLETHWFGGWWLAYLAVEQICWDSVQ